MLLLVSVSDLDIYSIINETAEDMFRYIKNYMSQSLHFNIFSSGLLTLWIWFLQVTW